MIRVEEATVADCEEILPLLAGFNNPAITPAQWRSLFHYSWPSPVETRGFILRDDQRAVGFFGTVWCEREIAGRRERFCNLTSWITLPEFRRHSLLLFKAVAALENCTITCHSPAPALYPLYRRFGFSDLETHLRIVPPRPAWQRPADWLGFRSTADPASIAGQLGEEDRRIFEAHRPHLCGHLLVSGRGGSCYLLFTRTRGKRFPFAHVHYLSDRAVFLRNLDRIRLRLLLATGTPLLMIDDRLVAGADIPHSRRAPLGVPRVYRSATLGPAQIDNLYSELILLSL